MRKKIIVSGTVLILSLVSLLGYKNVQTSAKENNNVVAKEENSNLITAKKIEEHSEKWTSFVDNVTNGRPDFIEIDTEDIFPHMRLSYKDNRIVYTCGSDKKEYKYLLELNGRIPGAEHDCNYVILANEKFSFEKFSLSTYTNDFEKSNIDYQLVYSYVY